GAPRGRVQTHRRDDRRGDAAIWTRAGCRLSRRAGRPAEGRGRPRVAQLAERVGTEGVAGYRLQPIPELPALLRAACAARHRPRDELVRLMESLTKLPPGVDETLDLVGRFDDCLVHGFARLGEEQRRSLE